MPKARFAGMIVFGPDTNRLAAFYEAGLGFEREYSEGEDVGLRVVTSDGNGSFTLLVHPGESRGVDLGTFAVDGLKQAVEQLQRNGAKLVAPPADTPWGTREAALTDPDGNGLLLTEASGA